MLSEEAEPVAGVRATLTGSWHQQPADQRQILEATPDHIHTRCLLGVWDREGKTG